MKQLTHKKKIQQLNTQIDAALQTGTDLQTDILESEEIQDTIMEYISIVKQRVQTSCLSTRSLDVAAPVFTPTPPTREPVSRLPKLNLPTFSGDTLMWQTFRDSFHAAVHNCPSLNTEVQLFESTITWRYFQNYCWTASHRNQI